MGTRAIKAVALTARCRGCFRVKLEMRDSPVLRNSMDLDRLGGQRDKHGGRQTNRHMTSHNTFFIYINAMTLERIKKLRDE